MNATVERLVAKHGQMAIFDSVCRVDKRLRALGLHPIFIVTHTSIEDVYAASQSEELFVALAVKLRMLASHPLDNPHEIS